MITQKGFCGEGIQILVPETCEPSFLFSTLQILLDYIEEEC